MTILETCSQKLQIIALPVLDATKIDFKRYVDKLSEPVKNFKISTPQLNLSISIYGRINFIYLQTLSAISFIARQVIAMTEIVSQALHQLVNKVIGVHQKVAQFWARYAGYVIGPSLSLLGATIFRLALGKRSPTQGPLYISLFVGATVLITMWAVKFFKHPETKKIIQTQGMATALGQALPLPKPKIVEPFHSRNVLSLKKYESLMTSYEPLKADVVAEITAKNSFSTLKLFCDWVTKKIKLARANSETLAILKTTLKAHFSKTMRHIVLSQDAKILEEFLQFVAHDSFINHVYSKEELAKLITQNGFRLALVTKKTAVIDQFLMPKDADLTLLVLDAVLSSNHDKIIELTNLGSIDINKTYNYGQDDEETISSLVDAPYCINLLQATILSGDVENLKRIIASSTAEVDWKQLDASGRSLLLLSACSGSKQMWDFVGQFVKQLPEILEKEYLALIYAAIKTDNKILFEELYDCFTHEDKKGGTGLLILDLYEKAVCSNASSIQSCLEKYKELEIELLNTANLSILLKASLKGGHRSLFNLFFDKWKSCNLENSLSVKEALELAFSAKIPHCEIIDDLIAFEESFGVCSTRLDLELSSSSLLACLSKLSTKYLAFIFSRLSKQVLLKFMTQQGPVFAKLIKLPAILQIIIDRCHDVKWLPLACAAEAVKTGQLDTLKLLCARGIDSVKPLPGSKESLLSYSMLSFNAELVEVILSKSPPLSAVLINELKSRINELRCHRSDETAYAAIMRMLEAKSFERSGQIAEDPQLHLALVKAGAMEFVLEQDVTREDPARGLIATGLGYLGLL